MNLRSTFLLMFAALFLASDASARTWNPKKKRPKTRNPGASIRQQGPKYEAAPPPPSMQEVQDIIADQRPGSPTEIAAQGITGQAPCGDSGAIARARDLEAKARALAAELLSLASQSYSASVACATPPYNCTAYNNIIKRLNEINASLPALQAEAQAIAALAGAAGNCGGSSPLALPPSMTRDSVAKKFGFKFPGSPGGGRSSAGSLLPQGAFEQLEELAEMDGEEAGRAFDGRRHLGGLPGKMKEYAGKAARAAALEGRVQDSKARMDELKDQKRDPSEQAEYEYAKINYAELGPKYAALAGERREAAVNVANDALNSPPPSMAALPDPKEKPLYEDVKEALIEKKDEWVEEKRDEAIESLLSSACGEKCAKALLGIRDVTKEAVGLVTFDEKWKAAISQLGSASLSTDKVDALAEHLDSGSQKVWETATEKSRDVLSPGDDD